MDSISSRDPTLIPKVSFKFELKKLFKLDFMKNQKIYFRFAFNFVEKCNAMLSRKILGSLLMFFSGVLLLYLVGFAQGSGNMIHNAAHDARHASGFPCH